jgi:hypothetical protein
MSVVGGVPITWLWSEFCHFLLRRRLLQTKKRADPSPRGRLFSGIFGVLERTLLTTFVLWLPTGAGAFVGALLIAKAAIGWGDLGDNKKDAGRARYVVTMFGSMVSILWAVAWGIWGMPPPPHSN